MQRGPFALVGSLQLGKVVGLAGRLLGLLHTGRLGSDPMAARLAQESPNIRTATRQGLGFSHGPVRHAKLVVVALLRTGLRRSSARAWVAQVRPHSRTRTPHVRPVTVARLPADRSAGGLAAPDDFASDVVRLLRIAMQGDRTRELRSLT